MSNFRTTLFGGTLFAAGIAHAAPELQPAVAFDGLPATGAAQIGLTFSPGAVNTAGGSYHDPADAFFDIEAGVPGWHARAYVSPAGMGVFASGEPGATNGYAGRFAFAYFTVAEPADLVCRWDFSEEIPGARFQTNGCSVNEVVGDGLSNRLRVRPDNGAPDAAARRVRVLPGRLYHAFSFNYAINPDTEIFFTALLEVPCYADCDVNGVLNVDDLDCFASAFLAGEFAGADCTGDGQINIDDIDCFAAAFLAGCP